MPEMAGSYPDACDDPSAAVPNICAFIRASCDRELIHLFWKTLVASGEVVSSMGKLRGNRSSFMLPSSSSTAHSQDANTGLRMSPTAVLTVTIPTIPLGSIRLPGSPNGSITPSGLDASICSTNVIRLHGLSLASPTVDVVNAAAT
ncbi:hypothetical protein FIBSPDRAFT_894430 [Athelia psychrophila]|uniref:Uncharacterized protein n=1 Tax=Athelia psychrophila TaxID=1759441 RepID=A0A166FU57_9AGAM|nr:hypothetical protein FIBSPDRAFT_894430 [Fibularhizoctonia sp. CBS 109695]